MVKNQSSYYETYQTIFLIIFKIILIEILVIILNFLIRFSFFSFDTYLNYMIILIEIIFIQLINLYLILKVFVNWLSIKYSINSEEIKITEGLIKTKETTYEIKALQSMRIIRSLIGKIFNYGSIYLYNPVLKEEIIIKDIPNPEFYANIIQNREEESPVLIRRINK